MADEGKNGGGPDDKRRLAFRIMRYALIALGMIGAIVCAILFMVRRDEILFLPLALCTVVAMISLTYTFHSKGG